MFLGGAPPPPPPPPLFCCRRNSLTVNSMSIIPASSVARLGCSKGEGGRGGEGQARTTLARRSSFRGNAAPLPWYALPLSAFRRAGGSLSRPWRRVPWRRVCHSRGWLLCVGIGRKCDGEVGEVGETTWRAHGACAVRVPYTLKCTLYAYVYVCVCAHTQCRCSAYAAALTQCPCSAPQFQPGKTKEEVLTYFPSGP